MRSTNKEMCSASRFKKLSFHEKVAEDSFEKVVSKAEKNRHTKS